MEWQFGGWLRSIPAIWSWAILATVAAFGAMLIVWSYRRTLTTLPPHARWVLIFFRVAMLVALLFCLANPSRVERAGQKPARARTLAVVLDRSASMNVPDNRSETRLEKALRIWRPHAEEAANHFDRIEYYRFSTQLEKASDLDHAAKEKHDGPETHLYDALTGLLNAQQDAVVCLTDGLDTTGAKSDALVAAAQQRGTPIYFAAGRNRSKVVEQASIREIKTPPSVLRRTEFSPTTLVEITAQAAREVPLELWSGGKLIASTKLAVRPGANTLDWAPKISAGERGPMPLEFRLGSGKTQELAASTTQVVERKTVNVLYYQGALQWGYRFLLAALESDPSFKVSSVLNPALRVYMASASASHEILPDLPETAAGLRDFQIVVLAHVFADQLSPRQQQALVEYVRGGGGVLFIAPDTNATTRFAGTPLEKMLPVVFDSAAEDDRRQLSMQKFQDEMNELSATQADDNGSVAIQRRQDLPPLKPFAAPSRAPRLSAELFNGKMNPPMFADYAKVRSVKAAAEILAVHPDDRNGDKSNPRVLLARQQFGAGFAAALTTDLLWRWKMALPSESRASEKFWQQLMLSLAPPGGRGLRLVKLTTSAALDHAVDLRVEGSTKTKPVVKAISPTGQQRTLVPGEAENEDAGRPVNFTPDAVGQWRIEARDDSGNEAHITIAVESQVRTAETSNLPPDIEGLRQLAEATGGALIGDEPLFHATSEAVEVPEIKHVQPLWNSPWLIGILLGLYGAELITRRCFKLL